MIGWRGHWWYAGSDPLVTLRSQEGLVLNMRLAALTAYRAKLRDAVRRYGELEAYLRSAGCPAHRQAVAGRPLFLLEGEIRWVTEFIEELEAS